jgi:uncharacterized protein (TIGR02679 family)
VVENPSLISDAASGGWTGPPIICSSGRPSVAVVTLIRQLGAEGATCRQHAAFDGAGLGITAWLADRAGTIPWLMTANPYRAAVAVAVERRRAPLHGDLPDTAWDLGLAPAIREQAVAVYEEEVRFKLLSVTES